VYLYYLVKKNPLKVVGARDIPKCYTSQRARLMPFALQRYENTFENANVFENIFVFVIENALICAIKTKNPLKTYGKAL
jgi:hypothetical protein